MKKVILSVVAVFVFGFANAQEAKFGLKAGVDFANAHGKLDGSSYNNAETGFYAGGFVDITVSDKFHVQPELLYVSVNDLDQIQIPVLAKFPVVEDLSLLAGPDFGFLLDAGEGSKTLNFGLDLGLSFDLNEEFSLDGKYNFGLSNLVEGGNNDFSSKLSGFFFGLSYKF
ncbi:outer membrane beta-barrel protein [Flavobacterium palustre]|nr:outer membrane beta-barrel protein [Flavobacterium palustre]